MMGGDMFRGVGEMLILGFVAIVLIFVAGIYGIVDYFWLEDKMESSKPVVPEVVIKSKSVNGKVTADTTYVYKFN